MQQIGYDYKMTLNALTDDREGQPESKQCLHKKPANLVSMDNLELIRGKAFLIIKNNRKKVF
jgi:hypothetical protein